MSDLVFVLFAVALLLASIGFAVVCRDLTRFC
jgi:hypothetical protein